MIDFRKPDPSQRAIYNQYLFRGGRKCELSFVNLCLWGRQRIALVDGYLTVFSQFDRKAVYTFPLGEGLLKPVLDAIIADARSRGIPCCISGMDEAQKAQLEALYPGRFRFHMDRDTFDYIYHIDDLADLKGRKFQKKRNHLNKFRSLYPDWQVEPLTRANLQQVQEMLSWWYRSRQLQEPEADFHLEELALDRALADPDRLGLEGLVLRVGSRMVAFTLGSQLSEDCFDVHFEKAAEDIDGAYPAINQAFAAYLRDKYPLVRYLNREDDLGLEGLRKAKLSYNPAFLVEKYWARLWEDEDEA